MSWSDEWGKKWFHFIDSFVCGKTNLFPNHSPKHAHNRQFEYVRLAHKIIYSDADTIARTNRHMKMFMILINDPIALRVNVHSLCYSYFFLSWTWKVLIIVQCIIFVLWFRFHFSFLLLDTFLPARSKCVHLIRKLWRMNEVFCRELRVIWIVEMGKKSNIRLESRCERDFNRIVNSVYLKAFCTPLERCWAQPGFVVCMTLFSASKAARGRDIELMERQSQNS